MTKAKKTAEINYSAMNAEQAYKILNEIQMTDEKTLFDIVFDDDEMQNSLIKKLGEERFGSYMEEYESVLRLPEDERRKANIKLLAKYPEVLRTGNDLESKVKKCLLLNGEKTRELSALFTGKEPNDFKEAVSNSFAYIVFLKEV